MINEIIRHTELLVISFKQYYPKHRNPKCIPQFARRKIKFSTFATMDSKCHATGPNCARREREQTDGHPNEDSVYSAAMEPKKILTSEPTWQKLQDYYNQTGKNLVIKNLFAQDANRFNKYR